MEIRIDFTAADHSLIFSIKQSFQQSYWAISYGVIIVTVNATSLKWIVGLLLLIEKK